MECVIPGQNVKIFAKIIQAFARMSSDLFIEAQPAGLSIRGVNSSKTAYAAMLFHPDFFHEYTVDSTATSSDEFHNKCKVSMKSFLGVFKNVHHVEKCFIKRNPAEYKIIIQFECRLETLKTHCVSILEQESLQAVYVTDNVSNNLFGSHAIFNDIINHFQSNEEEISFEARADRLILKNYVEGAYVDTRFMRSQVTLQPDEFNVFQITKETDITFYLKELRSFLNLADSLNLDMEMKFETGGRPVTFILKNSNTFEMNLVMSTLSPDAADHYEDTQNSKIVEDKRKQCLEESIDANTSSVFNFDRAKPVAANKSKRNDDLGRCSTSGIENHQNVQKVINQNEPTKEHSKHSKFIDENSSKTKESNSNETSIRNEQSSLSIFPTQSESVQKRKSIQSLRETESEEIRVIFQKDSDNHLTSNQNEDDLCIPASPKQKIRRRLKNVFRNYLEPTNNLNAPFDYILAENSDEDV